MFKYAPKHEMQSKIDETIRNMDVWLLNPYNALQPWSTHYEVSKEEKDDGVHYLIKSKLKDRVVCEFHVAKEADIHGDFLTMNTIADNQFNDVFHKAGNKLLYSTYLLNTFMMILNVINLNHDDEPIKDEASLKGIVSDLKKHLLNDTTDYAEYTYRRPTYGDDHGFGCYRHRFYMSNDKVEYIVECYEDKLDLSILTSDMIICRHLPLSKTGWEKLCNHLKIDLTSKEV